MDSDNNDVDVRQFEEAKRNPSVRHLMPADGQPMSLNVINLGKMTEHRENTLEDGLLIQSIVTDEKNNRTTSTLSYNAIGQNAHTIAYSRQDKVETVIDNTTDYFEHDSQEERIMHVRRDDRVYNSDDDEVGHTGSDNYAFYEEDANHQVIGFHDGINNAEDCEFIRDESDNIIIKLMYALNEEKTARTGELSANYYFYAALDPKQPEQKHIVGIVKVKYVNNGAGLFPEIVDVDFSVNYRPPEDTRNTPTQHRVVAGETLTSIAMSYYRNDEAVNDILALNTHLADGQPLLPGTTLFLPKVDVNYFNTYNTTYLLSGNEIIGYHSPSIPPFIMPHIKKHHGLRAFLPMIVEVFVDIVAFATLQLELVPLATLSAGIGNVAGQLTGIALHEQHGFDIKRFAETVAMAAITAKIGSGKAFADILEKTAVKQIAGIGIHALLTGKLPDARNAWAMLATTFMNSALESQKIIPNEDILKTMQPIERALYSTLDKMLTQGMQIAMTNGDLDWGQFIAQNVANFAATALGQYEAKRIIEHRMDAIQLPKPKFGNEREQTKPAPKKPTANQQAKSTIEKLKEPQGNGNEKSPRLTRLYDVRRNRQTSYASASGDVDIYSSERDGIFGKKISTKQDSFKNYRYTILQTHESSTKTNPQIPPRYITDRDIKEFANPWNNFINSANVFNENFKNHFGIKEIISNLLHNITFGFSAEYAMGSGYAIDASTNLAGENTYSVSFSKGKKEEFGPNISFTLFSQGEINGVFNSSNLCAADLCATLKWDYKGNYELSAYASTNAEGYQTSLGYAGKLPASYHLDEKTIAAAILHLNKFKRHPN